MSEPGLQPEIDRLRADALALAKEAATGGVTDAVRARADQLAASIDEVRQAAGDPEVEQALADPILEVDWVRSNCALPTSTRLHWFLEEQGRTGSG